MPIDMCPSCGDRDLLHLGPQMLEFIAIRPFPKRVKVQPVSKEGQRFGDEPIAQGADRIGCSQVVFRRATTGPCRVSAFAPGRQPEERAVVHVGTGASDGITPVAFRSCQKSGAISSWIARTLPSTSSIDLAPRHSVVTAG